MHALYAICEINLIQYTETQKLGKSVSGISSRTGVSVLLEKAYIYKTYTEHVQLLI